MDSAVRFKISWVPETTSTSQLKAGSIHAAGADAVHHIKTRSWFCVRLSQSSSRTSYLKHGSAQQRGKAV